MKTELLNTVRELVETEGSGDIVAALAIVFDENVKQIDSQYAGSGLPMPWYASNTRAAFLDQSARFHELAAHLRRYK